MTKHTPGPWVQTPWDSTAIFDAKNLRVPIAQTFPADTCKQEAEANARLVAAAPQLLEALEDCADALSIFHHKSEGNSAVKKARAAIKAAK
jgi:hypothetical protein